MEESCNDRCARIWMEIELRRRSKAHDPPLIRPYI